MVMISVCRIMYQGFSGVTWFSTPLMFAFLLSLQGPRDQPTHLQHQVDVISNLDGANRHPSLRFALYDYTFARCYDCMRHAIFRTFFLLAFLSHVFTVFFISFSQRFSNSWHLFFYRSANLYYNAITLCDINFFFRLVTTKRQKLWFLTGLGLFNALCLTVFPLAHVISYHSPYFALYN